MDYLASRNLLPTFFDETNWSGRGQHVEYTTEEGIEIPLQVEKVLGTSASAVVESVICRRIRLARKTIHCGRRIKREDAIKEVELLQNLSHPHIVQAVGTYVMGTSLSILLYPATEYNLETFIDANQGLGSERTDCLRQFFDCLAHTLSFLHSKAIKHMDIKPLNLLIRDVQKSKTNCGLPYKIYIADFGISRSYPSVADSETDSRTAFTRRYSATEVILQDKRGLSADVFSLGCVFVEMFAAVIEKMDELEKILDDNENGDTSYQANTERIKAWLDPFVEEDSCLWANIPQMMQMLDFDPTKRPTAKEIANERRLKPCCSGESDPFEAI
jgi:serine/threonine protein kinase